MKTLIGMAVEAARKHRKCGCIVADIPCAACKILALDFAGFALDFARIAIAVEPAQLAKMVDE